MLWKVFSAGLDEMNRVGPVMRCHDRMHYSSISYFENCKMIYASVLYRSVIIRSQNLLQLYQWFMSVNQIFESGQVHVHVSFC